MMRKVAIAVSVFGTLIAVPALAAAPTPIPYNWTGFYGGIEFGGGWSSQPVNYTPNDPLAAALLAGALGTTGEQAVPSGYRISQSGGVGGFELGYNWQAGTNWLLGLETDFSLAGLSGQASATSVLFVIKGTTALQTTSAKQDTDWYGTIRGRAGFLATPNLLLFGTGGFAYGRVAGSANYLQTGGAVSSTGPGSFSFLCGIGQVCFAGSSSAIRTGWTAGGGGEWLLDQHWSAKLEYQFVDLGTQTVRVTALTTAPANPTPASFNAAFRDQFHVVRVGLNYRY
jgi:outer membrane immunogenic protein